MTPEQRELTINILRAAADVCLTSPSDARLSAAWGSAVGDAWRALDDFSILDTLTEDPYGEALRVLGRARAGTIDERGPEVKGFRLLEAAALLEEEVDK